MNIFLFSRRHDVARFSALIALSVCGAVSCSAQTKPATPELKSAGPTTRFPGNRVSVGYLGFNKRDKYSWDDIAYENLTHINVSFVGPKSPTDPTVVYRGTDADFAGYDELQEKNFSGYLKKLVAKAHANDVKVLVSISGAHDTGASDLKSIFADDATRAQFIANLLQLCRDTGLDGVDLDYEYPTTADAGAGVTRFMTDLRAAADQKMTGDHFLLTMANGNSRWANRFLDFKSLEKSCDWFNIMSYSYDARWTKQAGHNAPLFADTLAHGTGAPRSVDESVKLFRDSFRVPPQQIVIGLAFYGWKYEDVSRPYEAKTGGTDLKYRDVVNNYLNKPGWKLNWSEGAQVPFLFNEETKSFVSYDDERAIAAKTNYAIKNDLRGVMIWELSRGFLPGQTQTQPLLGTIGQTLRQTPATKP